MIFLMRVQSFNIVCSLVFHNLYIVHAMKYIFLKYLANRGWWRYLAFQMDTIQRLLCITFMTSQSHLWRSCCIVMSRGPWLLRRCFKRGFGDHRKQPIYEFNWIVIFIEIQLIIPHLGAISRVLGPWGYIMKTHVRGFFDTDLHEVSWHFATHEAVRPSGF